MFGITLSTDSAAQPFWDRVDAASVLENPPSIRALGYRPHITLARYATVEVSKLTQAMPAFDSETAFSLTFDKIEIFDGAPLVLWLAPRRDQRLLDMHAKLHAILNAESGLCDLNYEPERWRPHLTVAAAIDVSQRDYALKLVSEPFAAFTLTFDQVDCVSWPPVSILQTRRLAKGRSGGQTSVDAAEPP